MGGYGSSAHDRRFRPLLRLIRVTALLVGEVLQSAQRNSSIEPRTGGFSRSMEILLVLNLGPLTPRWWRMGLTAVTERSKKYVGTSSLCTDDMAD